MSLPLLLLIVTLITFAGASTLLLIVCTKIAVLPSRLECLQCPFLKDSCRLSVHLIGSSKQDRDFQLGLGLTTGSAFFSGVSFFLRCSHVASAFGTSPLNLRLTELFRPALLNDQALPQF